MAAAATALASCDSRSDRFEWPLPSGAYVGSGSGTVKRSAAPNGGTASDPGRSRIGDRCALISGRSVESHQCR
jgi:hypothetical protein